MSNAVIMHFPIYVGGKDIELHKEEYCIDYQNGGMGNTLLSHILYSFNQVDFDIKDFFSDTGNSHNISQYINDISAKHINNDNNFNCKCIISFIATGFYEWLRIKMSYEKWYKKYPTILNYTDFFDFKPKKYNALIAYYNDIKDSKWPLCESVSDIMELNTVILNEVLSGYVEPEYSIENDDMLLQYLVIYYTGILKNRGYIHKLCEKSLVYKLQDYLNGEFGVIADTISNLTGWQYNPERSLQFYEYVRKVNKPYLIWFNEMQLAYNSLKNGFYDFSDNKVWEQSIILAEVCVTYDVNPNNIQWDNIHSNKKVLLKDILE